MLNKLKNLVIIPLLGFAMFMPLLSAGHVSAQEVDIIGNLCGGAEVQDGSTDCAAADTSTEGITNIASEIVNFLSWVVGIVSVIMIIVGGFKYITSGGASDKVTGAKNTIIYAIIGLIIVALAQFIVNFVIGKAISVDINS